MRKWWPPVSDWKAAHEPVAFLAYRGQWARRAKRGVGLNFAIVIGGLVRGEITLWDFTPTSKSLEVGVWGDPRVSNLAGLLAGFVLTGDHIFDVMKMERVSNPIAVGNSQSLGLTRTFGFSFEGTLRAWRPGPDGQHDYALYSLLATEWQDGRAKALKFIRRMDPVLAESLE